MNPPYTREFLQNYTLDDVLRNNAIENGVKMLTTLILEVASGVQQPSHYSNWKMVRNRVMMISDTLLRECTYGKTPHGTTKRFPENIPEVIRRLMITFPGVDFRQDEFGSYLIVDWS